MKLKQIQVSFACANFSLVLVCKARVWEAEVFSLLLEISLHAWK